jgi:hypothetical protein
MGHHEKYALIKKLAIFLMAESQSADAVGVLEGEYYH